MTENKRTTPPPQPSHRTAHEWQTHQTHRHHELTRLSYLPLKKSAEDPPHLATSRR